MKYLLDGYSDARQVADWLDRADLDRLRDDIDGLSRRQLLRLWALAERSDPIDLDHLCGRLR